MLHGREAERARLAALLEDAAASRGGSLVVRGDPGVGKTALLDDAPAGAGGWRVLRTQGIESEAPLAFAALYRLLRPVLSLTGALPAPQARALRLAFGQEEGTLGDRFVVFVAVLSLLDEAAEQAPVLCVVDDAHWLDTASAEALLFVARRLQADRIALLFGAREGDVRQFAAPDLPDLLLSGIDRAAVRELLSDHAGVPVTDEVSERLLAQTGGNPLALVELPHALSPAQLTGSALLPEQLPLTHGVERAFLDRCRRLSPGAQTVLLVAAADDSGRVTTIRAASALLGAGAEALDDAERSGLVRLSGAELAMRHPLVRSAVYSAATSYERQHAHRALVEVLIATDEVDRRAWHLSHATEEPDDEVATELDDLAVRTRRRGGHEAACSAFARAAELTAAADLRTRRLQSAAMSGWMAGQVERARALAEQARPHTGDLAVRAEIDALRGRVAWNIGDPACGHLVLQAAEDLAPADEGRALELAMLATSLVVVGGDPVDPRALVRPAAPADSEKTRCLLGLLAGHSHAYHGEMDAAARAFRAALALGETLPGELDLLVNLGLVALLTGDDAGVRHNLTRIAALTRETGALTFRLYVPSRLPFADLPAGRWDAVAAGAAEALELAPSMGQAALTGLPWAWLALLAALRGDPNLEDLLGEVERVRPPNPSGILALADDVMRWARGAAAASAGDPSGALHQLQLISHPVLQRLAARERIEAAVRAGACHTARTWVDELASFAAATGASWAAAVTAHGRALLAADADADADAEPYFVQALGHHQTSGRPVTAAHTRLAYGGYLRRRRRRVDAREHLRAALDTFEELGAEPWAERARHELRASGETARKRESSAQAELTPQELQIAQLAGHGMSNRDIAAQCFLSVRTIEFHLSNAYAKLGVHSRGELARLALA